MKKPLKISLISLGSLIGLIIIVLAIVFGIVLTPKRATSLVNKYASKFITCDYHLEKVDITIFKTFPDVGVKIENLVLLNKIEDFRNDTLAAIGECVISLDIKELLLNKNIVVNKANLDNGTVNAFIVNDSVSNFDIFVTNENDDENDNENDSTSYAINLNALKLNNIDLSYTDWKSGIGAECKGLDLNLKGNMNEGDIRGNILLNINDLSAYLSSDSTSMNVAVDDLSLKSKANYSEKLISGNPEVKFGKTRFAMIGGTNINLNFSEMQLATNCVITDVDDINCETTLLKINGLSMILDTANYCNDLNVGFESPQKLNYILSKKEATFDKISLAINDILIDLAGNVAMNGDDININANLNTNTLAVANTINLIPQSIIGDALEGMSIDGKLQLNACVSGVYNKKTMPLIKADVVLNDGFFNMPKVLPYPVKDIKTSLKADIDLNKKSNLKIDTLVAKMNNSIVGFDGYLKNVLSDQRRCDVHLKADVKSDDIKSFLPENIKLDANILAIAEVRGNISDIIGLNLDKSEFEGKVTLKDLNVNCFDTINANSTLLEVGVAFPRRASDSKVKHFAQFNVRGNDLQADISEMMSVDLSKFEISGFTSNVLRDAKHPSVVGEFEFGHLHFNMDDIDLDGVNANGALAMLQSINEGNISYSMVFDGDDIDFSMEGMNMTTESIALSAIADYDEKGAGPLLKWNPEFDVDLSRATFNIDNFDEMISVPTINMKYDEKGLMVEDSRFVIGNSDFGLKGTLTNLSNYLKHKELLQGEFKFTSDYTDITQLMNLFSGMGKNDTVAEAEQIATDTIAEESDPFMVPLGTDIQLHTLINRATFGDIDVRNVGGDFTVKDGNLVLQEVGFTTDAATMMLTAIYKSPRENNLYLGFDFHLLDIDIAEMIRLVPDIDTIVPMLKAFAGDAEFHFAAETNLKSDYSIKFSTLKAACSIEGKDLVVLDSETFGKIKKYLMFDKNTSNKIDSLDVQFTLFRNEIDVYPFLVSLDKYQVALYGRHNLDMSYDYNFSVINPWPINKLGLELKGPNFDEMQFKLRRGRVKNLYVPEKRDYVEEKILELKKIISNSLKDNVKSNY